MSQEYKIQLGIDFNDGELKNIKKQLTGLTNDTHRIRIDIDNSRLLKQVAHAKRELRGLNDLGGSKGNSPTLKMDTESVENALNRVANSIDEIRASLNTLDGKSGMQSLVASVNQIASALGKATDESETLVKTLSTLGKKDFSVNLDLKFGGGSNSFSNTAAYGDYVRRKAVPELRKQAESMMNAIREQYKDEFFSWQSDEYVLDTLARRKSYSPAKSVGLLQKEMIDGRNLSKQMAAHSEFINLVKDIGDLSGVDMSGVATGFSRTADEIIQNAFDIQSGVKNAADNAEESAKKLKNIFGASIDADSLSAQLTPIVEKLEEIRVAISNLSNNDSLGGLTASFDKLSETLETLLANAKQVQDTLGSSGVNADISTDAQKAADVVVQAEERKQQAIKETRRLISDSAQSAIDAVTSKSIDTAFKVDKSDSDAFRREMENLVSQWTDAKGKLTDIKINTESFYDKDTNRYIEEITRAQVTYNNELGETIKKNIALRKIGEEQTGVKYDKKTKRNVPVYEPIYGFVETTGQYSKSLGKTKIQTDAFVKQQKQVVANLTNQINQLNRAANDQNAARPIKLDSHLTSLKDKYNEITAAIQRMENASSDTFVDEQNNVKKLISEFKSLVSEYKNAENVSTKMKGTDFASGLKIAKNDLEKFKAEAEGFSVDMSKLDIDSVVDASSLNNFNDQLRIAKSELAKVKFEAAAANRNEKVGINISGLQSKIADIQRISPEINEFKTNINGAEVSVESLLNDLSKVKTQGDFSTINSKFRSFTEAAKAAGIAVSETASKTKNELAKQIKIDLQTDDFKTQINSIEQDAKKLSGTYREIDGSITKLNQALANMKTAAAQDDVEGLIKSYKEYKATLEVVENQIEQNRIAEKNATDLTKLNQKKQSLSLEMSNWLKDNSAAAKDFGARIRELQAQIDACDDASLGNLKREFQNIKKEAQLAGKTTKTVGDRIKEQFAQYSTYIGVAEVFMWAEQGLRDMFEQVKLIDSAMTELKKVTNETDDAYNRFLTNAASRAKEIGTTIDGLVSSTADFARLGYEFADAQGLAEVANIYAVVGDDIDSVEAATQSLISTLTAFKDEAGDLSESDFALSIVDKMNEVSNNFAISSGGIGDALQRSASSMMAANNSLDETIALITAANTVVQDPDAIGTAFKTISMRIRGAKTELEDAGLETEGMVSSTAKLREEVMALSGVDIMINNNEFKSTYQIMEELAEKWQDLTDIQQASVTELIAGKRQGNIVSSLMNNFDIAEQALETSLNSAGSAMTEHEKWQQSLEAQILKLEAAWQSLSQSFMDSSFLKGSLDAVIGLVEAVNWLIDTFGTIPTLIGAFAAFESFQGVGIFNTIKDEATGAATGITSAFNKIKVAIDNVKSEATISFDTNFADALAEDKSSLQMYELALNSGMSAQEAFDATMQNASPSAQQYAKTVDITGESIQKFADQQKMSELSMKAQDKSWGNCSKLINSYNKSIEACELTQEQFLQSIQASNPALHKYLSGLNGANGSFKGYIASLIGAKVATFALEAATMALNAAITMGISALVSFAIKAFDEMYESADELAERIDEVVTKFNDQQKELVKNKASFKSDAERYAELSKGVDKLGRNLSLTTEEYSEYQSVVNSVAEQVPSLVSGYDSQGNAILNVKNNVDELVAAYEKLIEAQNSEVLSNAGDIQTDFKNAMESADNMSAFNDKLITKDVNALKEMIDSDAESPEKVYEIISKNNALRADIVNALEKAGIENDLHLFSTVEDYDVFIADAVKNYPNVIKSVINSFEASLEAETDGMRSIAEAALSSAFDISSSDYYDMSDTLKNVARQMVNGFDYEFFAGLEADGVSVEDYVNNMVKQLDSISDRSNEKIEAAFDLQTQFNGGEISYGEYVKGLEETGKLINTLELEPKLKTQLKLSVGLNEAGFVDEYQNLVNRLSDHTNYDFDSRITASVAEEFLNSLTAEELPIANSIIKNLSSNDIEESIQDIRAAINRQMAVEGLTFGLNFEVEAASIDAFNTALTESVTASGLSSDSIAALKGRYEDLESQGYDLSSMFEETSHGIHLNKRAVNELEKAYAKQKQTDIKEDLQSLQKEYDLLTSDIDNCNDASKRASLYVQRDAIAQQINDAATLAAQYEGLTSAYNDWLAAEEAGQERDMYEQLIEGLENIDDEISRGWMDDGTIEFLELLTGKDLSTSSIEDLKAAYKGLSKEIGNSGYSIRDFFTVNEDRDSTNTGVYNFLETIETFEDKLGDVIQRKDGKIKGFNFSVAGGDEAIAEALGISEELVQIMVRAADDAGFVVTLDGAYTQLADLKTSAEEANIVLKQLGKTDVNFNFGAKSLEDLNGELAKADEVLEQFRNKDGTINMEMDGAEEALEIASYFTATIDKLTEPVYMQLETNQVEKDLQEPLTKMQEFERLSKQKHQLTLTGDTEDLKKVEAEMNEIATYLDGLDEETQIKLGIDGLSMEEIKSKLEQGEIEIPATVDIQLEMSEDIKDMRLMMMNQIGLISDEQLKLEIEYGVDSSAIEDYTPEQQKAIVEYFVEHDEVDSYTPEEKEALVKFIAESGNIDDYTPEEKQAIVEYLTDSGDPDSWTPEQKEAVAKFKKDSAEVDSYTPEQKEAIAKYIKDSSDPDNYQPNNKDATVTYEKDSTAVDSYDPPNLFRKVFYDIIENTKEGSKNLSSKGKQAAGKRTGSNLKVGEVNGTAHAHGTAFKRGDWRTKKTETALTGELGREIVVTPDNQWYTVGDAGAEFATIPRGSIVFNHKQTEELLSNGRVTSNGGRAKALVSGTAYAKGTGGIGKYHIVKETKEKTEKTEETFESGSKKSSKKDSTKTTTKGSTGSGGVGKVDSGKPVGSEQKSGSSSSKDKFEETIDWIEVVIDRVQRAIDQLDQKANNVYKSWSERNGALKDEIGKVGDEIEIQQKAYDRYIKEANSVGLSESYAKKVRDGTIDIEDFEGDSDEKLVEKIKEYQDWYNKALDCRDAIEELKETEASLYQQRFENVSSQYEGILGTIEHEKNMLEEYINQSETQGWLVSYEYYRALSSNEKRNIAELEKQKADMLAELQNAMESGTIKKGSEAW